MSNDPKRYAMSWDMDEDDYIYVSPMEQPNGKWVKWEDYARLKAEVEQLRRDNSVLAISVAEMKAYIAIRNAAKEGKPSV